MKSIIADTNVYLRFILDDVKSQARKAEDLFKRAQKKELQIVVPQIVIFEIQFALDKYYKFKKDDVIKRLETIVPANFLNIESRSTFMRCIKIFENNNVSFVDSFLKAEAEKEGMELFSFDKKLVKL